MQSAGQVYARTRVRYYLGVPYVGCIACRCALVFSKGLWQPMICSD